MKAPTRYRSPFSTEAVVDDDGEVLVIDRPKGNRLEILKLIARYELLTIPYIAAALGTKERYLRREIQYLKSDPNFWLKITDSQTEHPKRHRFDKKAFELTDRAEIYLRDNDVFINPGEFTGGFDHKLMSAQVRFDFDYGAQRTKGVRIIPFDEMLADPRLPEKTRKLNKPYLFTVSIKPEGKRPIERGVRFDSHPFIVERKGAEKPHMLVLGLEIDRATESVKTLDYFRSSIRRKFVEQAALLDSGIVRERFGFPFGYIIYVSASKTRLENMMGALEEETTSKPSLRKHFLFALHKDATENPEPTGAMLTGDYARVGYPAFNFVK